MKFDKFVGYIIFLLLCILSFFLLKQNFYNADYIVYGDMYKLSELQGEIEGSEIVIKLFFILNNISILLFLLNRKILSTIVFALLVYFVYHLVELDLFFIIVSSTIKAGNYVLIIIFALYALLLLINIYSYLRPSKLR
ncbi:transcriptional regulator [Neisseria perflava]|jgi:transcriptional regulator ATRX|nr:transcriptional regulator [Neisseria perflava]